LSLALRSELRFFAFYLANRTLCLAVLDGIDYEALFNEPSALEQAMAIYANVLEIDAHGMVVNSGLAQRRAAQYIREYFDPEYTVTPPFEEWELDLAL
jgi:hypothetical protein